MLKSFACVWILTGIVASGQTQFETRILNPEIFPMESLKRDASGKYVVVDDMLFKVSTNQKFASLGGQWPNGSLNYDFAPDVRLDATKRKAFIDACNLITAESGIGCIDVQLNPIGKQNYVYVTSGNVNQAVVGKQGGAQSLILFNWNSPIIVAHEIKHALGWVHEHQRMDRDLYVTINWSNIAGTNPQANFGTMTGAWEQSPMDFESIMTYGRRDFAKPGKESITPLPQYSSAAAPMGQRLYVSKGDLAEVNAVYGKKGTEWCGLNIKPRTGPPAGCFFDCKLALDPTYGTWLMCGSCPGAQVCP